MILPGRRAAAAFLWLASSTAAGDAMAEEVRTKAGLVEGTAEPEASFNGLNARDHNS